MQLHFKQSSESEILLKRAFEGEKQNIRKLIPDCDIQHIGSTAVPGMLTKGDLDILVRVKADQFLSAREKLETAYKIDQGNPPTETYTGFEANQPNLPIGVQLVTIDSPEDVTFLKVRNMLLKSRELRDRFNALKMQFEGKDNAEYRKAKAEFLHYLLLTER